MRICKALFVMLVVVVAMTTVILPTYAESGTLAIPSEEWEGFEGAIPDEVRDKLIDGTCDSAEGFESGVSEMSQGSYFVSVLLEMVGVELDAALKLMFGLCALVIISAIFSALGEGSENGALLKATRFCSVGAVIGAVIYVQYSHFEMLEKFLSSLESMVGGIIPVTACIWAMGGNVSTASVGSASFATVLSVSQAILSYTLIPVCSLLTVLGFCDSLTDEIRLGRVMSAIKRIYNFVLGLVMTILLSSLGAQTTLAASADSAAARTARFVSGTVIPVLGGSVGETFRTVATGVSYLKNVFGIGSIIMIALLVLPVVITLALTRFAFLLVAAIADMLGCSAEAKALEHLGEVYGTMLAVVSGVSVMFIMVLCVFMQSVVAVV